MKEKSSIQYLKEQTQSAFEILATDKEKVNIKYLKESFKDEIYFPFECDGCNGNVGKESYCKNCSLWQISPDIEESKENRYTWGNFTIQGEDGKNFSFNLSRKEFDINNKTVGIDYLTEIDVFRIGRLESSVEEMGSRRIKDKIHIETVLNFPRTIALHKLLFYNEEDVNSGSPQVIFISKESIKGKMIYESLDEVVKYYDIYRRVPNVLRQHSKHGKCYEGKNIYRKLELIK